MTEDSRLVTLDARPHYYILDGQTPVAVADGLTWGRRFATVDRRVAFTALPGGVEISTVFLGLDHAWTFHGPPVLFETMVFQATDDPERRDSLDDYTQRYSTWQQAQDGHDAVCATVRAWLAEVLPAASAPR